MPPSSRALRSNPADQPTSSGDFTSTAADRFVGFDRLVAGDVSSWQSRRTLPVTRFDATLQALAAHVAGPQAVRSSLGLDADDLHQRGKSIDVLCNDATHRRRRAAVRNEPGSAQLFGNVR